MTYALPVNQTGIGSIFSYANSVTNNVFGIGFLISFYVIILLYLKGRATETADAFIVAGFLSSILGVMLFMMGVVGGYALFMVIMMCALPIVWSFFNKG